ncbi:DUF5107 domain-containing protein [Sphingobacterium sp. DN00404]|uniref:DUF5107 domain-containing protein n=1 Tax=Sphingobacterium micropteri TaxID=2763501 RepID=A0ABR7YP72_9SPHI|nr:DUF5107 domain-containing protein [Sphingobacterium micropteri]MBD1433106.1 DUF5107 domain-containing protein [Sphingobacterium micropteri]
MDVKIWQESVTIGTYEVGKPDTNPMFFESRVYQGSSGTVYPYPIIESISDKKIDKVYHGLFLENQYIKIMVLPELGGRIQMAYDKIAHRHFIYYNQVIKPALVGLCGPWISGGIEFNWPQHHRPSTFDPVDFALEENVDGSKTIWVSEVEKMFHTKGMAGFTLHPDKAFLEINVKLHNRTPLPQTFLWWANPAVRVNEHYQSVFPPDVSAVFDHGKRDVSSFPMATGTYYKVDYAPGTDISKYKNIPVPTSYMAVNSRYDFVGGYEHDSKAGVLHVANHHVSPGKKQWTWGNGDFGLAWDRNLTDNDGPYIELMTGVFTDNQPDFSWLMPYEEKAFTQYFLPYRAIGMVKNASKDFLLGLEHIDDRIIVRVFATSVFTNVRVTLQYGDLTILDRAVELSPTTIFQEELRVDYAVEEDKFKLVLHSKEGAELLRYEPSLNDKYALPPPAEPAPRPEAIGSIEQLFLVGQHLEQYRHAIYNPVSYYEEALRRDPTDVRSNNAMGKWYLRKGRFVLSIPYFKQAIATLTSRNPNPYDSEPYYNFGLAMVFGGNLDAAYDAFYKATWSSAWQDSAFFALAQIDAIRGDFDKVLEHIDWSLDRNARNGKAYVLKAFVLRQLGLSEAAIDVSNVALKRDPFNLGTLFEAFLSHQAQKRLAESEDLLQQFLAISRQQPHTLIEYAIDFAAFGAYRESIEILSFAAQDDAKDPLIYYYTAYYWLKLGDRNQADAWLTKATSVDAVYCFPNRLEDILVLETVLELNPEDAGAAYYLGNLWYDKRQYELAISCWEKTVSREPNFPKAYRNLAIAAYNKQDDIEKAVRYFERAFVLDNTDARILMELDQLYKRLNYPLRDRLATLEKWQQVAEQRDDLYLEISAIYNLQGHFQKAYDRIMNRKFHPWEGGEGKVSTQYSYSLVELAKEDLRNSRFSEAIDKLNQAQSYPYNLGEGKLPGAQENDIFYWMGCAYERLGELDEARSFWTKATVGLSEPAANIFYNDQQPDKIFYQGLAWKKLGDKAAAEIIFRKLYDYGMAHLHDDITIDYFAVSLPDLLIFKADLQERNRLHCLYISALGLFGIGDYKGALQYLDTVVRADNMHFGAHCHLKLLHTPALNILSEMT